MIYGQNEEHNEGSRNQVPNIMKDGFCFFASVFHQVGIERPFCVIPLNPVLDAAGSLVGINWKSKAEGGEKEGKKIYRFLCVGLRDWDMYHLG